MVVGKVTEEDRARDENHLTKEFASELLKPAAHVVKFGNLEAREVTKSA